MRDQYFKPNRITYNSIMNLAVKSEKMETALKLVQDMQKDDISPDGFTYSILLTGLKLNKSSKSLVKKSLKNIERVLHDKTFKQDQILYNSIMDLASRYELYEEVVRFHRLMKENNLKETSLVLGVLVKMHSKKDQINKAYAILNFMMDNKMGINDITYGFILDACTKKGDMVKAIEIFTKLEKNNYILNSIVFTTIIKGYKKQKDYNGAYRFFNSIKHKTELPGVIITFNCLLDIHSIRRDHRAAIALFNEIDTIFGADLITYSTLIKTLCKCRK